MYLIIISYLMISLVPSDRIWNFEMTLLFTYLFIFLGRSLLHQKNSYGTHTFINVAVILVVLNLKTSLWKWYTFCLQKLLWPSVTFYEFITCLMRNNNFWIVFNFLLTFWSTHRPSTFSTPKQTKNRHSMYSQTWL